MQQGGDRSTVLLKRVMGEEARRNSQTRPVGTGRAGRRQGSMKKFTEREEGAGMLVWRSSEQRPSYL